MTEPSAELEELVAELVSHESENPPGNEAGVVEFIIDWFDERGIDADRVEVPDPERPQVGVKVGEGEPRLVLNGHIDVVPAGDLEEWDHDPYGAERDGSHLYGRGSVDMKSGVAIGMLVTAALAEEVRSGELAGSLVFQAAMGEETADPGTKSLLEEGYDGDYGVVLEPTELRTATTEKGLAWYEITVEGEPSHASRPDQGENAILGAGHVIDALESYDERIRAREDDLVGRAYATVTMFEAGTKENVLPEEAVLTIDRRFLPEEDVEEIDAEMEGLLNGVEAAHGVETTWERTRTYEAAEIPVDSPLAETFRDHAQDVAGVTRQPFGTTGSTDVRNFINDVRKSRSDFRSPSETNVSEDAGMEAITWGPGDTSQAHTYDEHVDLAAVADGREILERAAREILSGQ